MSAKDMLETYVQLEKYPSLKRKIRDKPMTIIQSVFLHCPLVAEEWFYYKNVVSIRTKLFPLNSLSQYWARLFVLFQ